MLSSHLSAGNSDAVNCLKVLFRQYISVHSDTRLKALLKNQKQEPVIFGDDDDIVIPLSAVVNPKAVEGDTFTETQLSVIRTLRQCGKRLSINGWIAHLLLAGPAPGDELVNYPTVDYRYPYINFFYMSIVRFSTRFRFMCVVVVRQSVLISTQMKI